MSYLWGSKKDEANLTEYLSCSDDESEHHAAQGDNDENLTLSEKLASGATQWFLKLGVSGLLGYCSGYFIKKTLKVFAYYVGGFFCIL